MLKYTSLDDNTIRCSTLFLSRGSVLVNDEGLFDKDEKLYGNEIRIKRGKEGDTYDQLILMFAGYIRDYTVTTSEFIIDCADKRERLQAEYPDRQIEVLDKYVQGEGWETRLETLPDGYGDVVQVLAYPVDIMDMLSYLQFNGINSYIAIPYEDDLQQPELCLIIRAYMSLTVNNNICLIGNYFVDNTVPSMSGWLIYFYSGNIVFNLTVGALKTRTLSVDLSKIGIGWKVLKFAYNKKKLNVYLDGDLLDTREYVDDADIYYYDQNYLTIGCEFNPITGAVPNTFLEGKIDYIKLYSDADETNLVADWKFDEGSGTVLGDSENGYDGTIYNCNWEKVTGVQYIWGMQTENIDKIFVQGNDLKITTPSMIDNKGTFVCDYADVVVDGVNPQSGIKEVYVTGRMRDIDNPAEIIVDLNRRIYGTDYNNSTYDVAELEAEKTQLAKVGLYMGEPKRVYEWIELLQNGSTIGFRYEDTLRRTIRCDLPDRPVVVDIQPIDIRNDDMPVKRNAELYASSCVVKYAYNHRTDSYKQVENIDYQEQVIDEHRVKKVQEYESLLTTKADADDKALIVMKDIHEVRPIVTLRVDSEKYPQPRIFDMVTARVSVLQQQAVLPEIQVGNVLSGADLSGIFAFGDDDYVLGDDNIVLGEFVQKPDIVLGDEWVIGDIANWQDFEFAEAEREYLGAITGQVIGINWLTETNEVEIAIRQRL